MNLKKLYNIVNKEWNNLGFEIKKLTDDKIEMTASIVAEKYFDDDVYCKISAYKDGSLHVMFTFDKLDANEETYELINAFNDNLSWFKAYIADCGDGNFFFRLHYAGLGEPTEKAMAEVISFTLNTLLADNTMKYLKPITELTYSD